MEAPSPVTSNYAWCVVVFNNGNDDYAKGAVVVANSLYNVETKYPTVCLHHGLSPETVDYLGKFFERVVEVPLIEHKTVPMKSKKQQEIYGKWIHRSFTKWHCANVDYMPYEKVILIDADALVVKNCDCLFDLPAPAGVFNSPWARPYVQRGGIYNPYLRRDRNGTLVPLEHGAAVQPAAIEKGLTDSFVVCGNLVLLSPSKRLSDELSRLLHCQEAYGSSSCIGGFDEQIITRAALNIGQNWTHIHPSYSCYVGKEKGYAGTLDVSIRQWYNSKPWDMKQSPYKDIAEWWEHWNAVTCAHPLPPSLR